MRSKQHLTIVIILFLFLSGLIFRLYHVGRNPAGFFCDEASIGYNAYLLVTTGKDEHGQPFPMFFRSFGDYRPPLPFYTAIPFVMAFGLNEFAVRSTTAVIGSLTILLVAALSFLLAQQLFKAQREALWTAALSAFLLTISSWHIHMSRFGSEYIYLPFAVLGAVTLFLVAWNRPRVLPFSAAAAALVSYTYLPGVLIGPLLFIGLSVIGFPRFRQTLKYAVLSVTVYLLLMLPVLVSVLNGNLLTRWYHVGITNTMQPSAAGAVFLQNYISHFSPLFLFTKGDIDYPGHFITRYSVRGLGELYPPDTVFFPVGLILFTVLAIRRKRQALLPLLLLLLYPLGSSITITDSTGPMAFRSVIGSAVFPLFSAFGIMSLFRILRSNWMRYGTVLVITGVYLLSFGRFAYLYTQQYPLYSEGFWGWQYGPREVMKYFLANSGSYSQLMMIGEFNAADIFLKFYDPHDSCRDKCINGDESKIRMDGTQLVAISASRFNSTPVTAFRLQKIISYPDGSPAFYIGTYIQPAYP